MEDWNINQMTPFDCRIATQSLQLTKLLIPYLPGETQRIMAIYVKFMEFQNTWSSFRVFRQKTYTTQDVFQELRPYMPASACESIDNIMNMMSMMEMMQNMQEMQESNNDDTSGFGFDPMQMMQGMLTPEQQGMFEMYNNMFTAETETNDTETNETETIKKEV